MGSEKQIIHMDQDAFFVSVEVRKNPDLVGKPVVIGGSSDRGVVASCSYEARKFGVHAAMSSRMAKMLCPHAIFIRGNMDEYSKASHEITDILKSRVPLMEKASIDEHYIDMTGMDRFHNTLQFARELRQSVIKETGLPISFGLSVNKTVSKIATNECKPNGELNVNQPEVQPFLNPLSIKKIPGLGEKTFIKLSDMGIKKIYTLSQIHPDQMNMLLGKNGKKELLWDIHALLGGKVKPVNEAELFHIGAKSYAMPELVNTKQEDAYHEFELLGFPVTLSMFDLLQTPYRRGLCTNDLIKYLGKTVKKVGLYVCEKTVHTKSNKKMWFGTFLDAAGNFFDTVHFPNSTPAYPFRGVGCYLILGKVVEDFGFPSIEVIRFAKLPIIGNPVMA